MTNNNNNIPPVSSSSCSAQGTTPVSMSAEHRRAMGYRSTRIPTLRFSMTPTAYSLTDKDASNTRFKVTHTGRLPVADIIEIALGLLDDYNNYPVPNESDVSPSQSSEL